MTEEDTGDINDWEAYLADSRKKFLDRYVQNFMSDLDPSDFSLIQTIGRGSYGTVVLATCKQDTDKIYYAIKIIEKRKVVQKRQVKQASIEKRLLFAIRFPFIVHMFHFLQDTTYLYYVLPYLAGGDMFRILRKARKFDERKSAFYAAQVVLALEYLHSLSVVYRDLKPENLLFDLEGYLKVTDLGFAKVVDKRTYTLCGTPDYLAPEVVLNQGYAHGVDWWALGVLIFEMCAGLPPFYAKDVRQTYESIIKGAFRCPALFSQSLRDIVDKLLQVDASRRLGCLRHGVDDIKWHNWFRHTSWHDILNKKVKPPYVPKIKRTGDTRHFEELEDFRPRVLPEEEFKEEFEGF